MNVLRQSVPSSRASVSEGVLAEWLFYLTSVTRSMSLVEKAKSFAPVKIVSKMICSVLSGMLNSV